MHRGSGQAAVRRKARQGGERPAVAELDVQAPPFPFREALDDVSMRGEKGEPFPSPFPQRATPGRMSPHGSVSSSVSTRQILLNPSRFIT